MAHTPADLQLLLDRFSNTCNRFGLKISLKKTEIMVQTASSYTSNVDSPRLLVDNVVLPISDKFCYLGIYLTDKATIDTEIDNRISKASSAFGKLHKDSGMSMALQSILN